MSFLPNPVPFSVLLGQDQTKGTTDAFGRARQSQPFTVFDSQFHFDKQPLIWDEAVVAGGAATYNANQNAVELTCGTGATDSITRQTFDRHYYQPGKSQLIMCTGTFGAPKANTRKRVGFFDANDGLFLEIDGSNAKVVRRTSTSGSPVDNAVNQASWNVDPMDGTGPSGITLNFDHTQIFAIDLEWLGVGAVRFGFIIGGVFYVVHRLQNANNGLTLPYMARATLPIRYQLTNTAAPASSTTLRQICATVISEGGQNPAGIGRSAVNTKTFSSGSIVPMISIRLKAAALSSKIVLANFSFAGDASVTYLVSLWRNPTLDTPSWASVGADSIAEISATAGTVAITGGTRLLSYAVTGNAGSLLIPLDELIPAGATISGTPIHLTLAANKATGGGASHSASLNWKELQ